MKLVPGMVVIFGMKNEMQNFANEPRLFFCPFYYL